MEKVKAERSLFILVSLFSLVLLSLNTFSVTPVVYDFNANDDNVYTTSASVTLALSGDDINRAKFSCNNSTWSSWWNFSSSSNTTTFNLNTGEGCSSGDANKTVYATIMSVDGNSTTASDSITLDTNAPDTSDDLNSNSAYQGDVTVTFSCSDSPAGCSATRFRIDTNPSDTVDFSASSWVSGTSFNTATRLEISGDGNWAIDYNSTDNAGNVESPNRAYFVKDSTDPVISFVTPTSGSTVNSNAINVLLSDNFSRIKLSSITMDFNKTGSDFNSSTCTSAGDGNYNCAYSETSVDVNGDYNFAVYVLDIAGNDAYSEIVFKYSDLTAPATPNTPSLSSTSGSSITISWQKNSDYDIGKYNVYRAKSSNITIADGNIIGTYNQSSCSSSCLFVDSNNILSDTNYYYKIQAVDKSTNKSSASAYGGPFSLGQSSTPSAPSISSSTHSNGTWDKDNDVNLAWNSVSGTTGYSYTFSQNSGSTPDTTTDTTGTSKDYNDQSDGNYVFSLRACNGTDCSGTSTFTVLIDTLNPGAPSSLSTSVLSDGGIELSWTGGSDSTSGINEYEIFRETSSGVGTSSVYATTSDTEYTDSSTSNGITYYYVVRAKDKAGNVSSVSNEASAKSASGGFALSFDVPAYAKKGSVVIKVNGTESFSDGELSVKKPGESNSIMIAGGKSGTSMSYTYEFGSAEGSYRFTATATNDGTSYTKSYDVLVDNTSPSVAWISPESASEQEGTFELKASASDSSSGIKTVRFYYNNILIGTATKTKDDYVYSWTPLLAKGNYTLKVTATDNAGNIRDATILVSLKGGVGTEETQKELDDLILAETSFNELFESLSKTYAYSPDFLEEVNDVKAVIAEVNTLMAAGNYTQAKAKAIEGQKAFAELEAKAKSTYEGAQGGEQTNLILIVLGILIAVGIVAGAVLYPNEITDFVKGLKKEKEDHSASGKDKWPYQKKY